MKIVHVFHSYYPIVGGMERVVQSLAEEQARMGHEVHVITSRIGARNNLVKEELSSGVHVHRIKALRFHYPDLTIPRESCRDLLQEADVVHAHSQNSMFNIMVAEKAKELRVKVAVHFMAVDAYKNHTNVLLRILASFYGNKMVKKALKLADLKLVKSVRDARILREKFGVDNLHYVPDGVDEELLRMPSLESEFREKHGIHEDNVVLFVGRLHPLKGIEVLLRAIPHVIKKCQHVKFVFIGPGNSEHYKKIANKLGVADKVLFLGLVDERTKIGALDSSTCLVLPSMCDHVEVYSLVISEAWARGKPVIGSNVGEIPYRIKNRVNGILVPPRDPNALAKAILELLMDKEASKRMGSEGKKELKSWKEVASILVSLYNQIQTY